MCIVFIFFIHWKQYAFLKTENTYYNCLKKEEKQTVKKVIIYNVRCHYHLAVCQTLDREIYIFLTTVLDFHLTSILHET